MVDVVGGGLGLGYLPSKVSCIIIVTEEISMVIDIIDTIDINKWLISEYYQTSHYELLTNRNWSQAKSCFAELLL